MVDSNPTIQRTAADTLEKINPQIYNQVVTVLHDNQNRSNALKELQRMGTAGKGALPALFAVYTTNDGRIYKSASEILETMVAIAPESQDVIALILNILSLDTNRVASRRSAAESHKHIAITLLHDTKADSKKATQALIVCLSDSQADIRTLAAKTLAKYGPDAKAALPTLQKMKLDSSKEVREAVAAAINAIN